MPDGYQGTDIWDVSGRRVVAHLPDSDNSVGDAAVAYSPTGGSLAICSSGEVFLYEIHTGRRRRSAFSTAKPSLSLQMDDS
jgi:hypothetical protein